MIIETIKPLKGRSLNNVKFISVLSILCILFLASVFIFNYFLSTSIQVATVSNTVPVVNNGVPNVQINKTVAASDEHWGTQNDGTTVNAVFSKLKVRSAMSESEFRQEAQNTLFRDSEERKIRMQAYATKVNADLSDESFRVEAKKVLYREED